MQRKLTTTAIPPLRHWGMAENGPRVTAKGYSHGTAPAPRDPSCWALTLLRRREDVDSTETYRCFGRCLGFPRGVRGAAITKMVALEISRRYISVDA